MPVEQDQYLERVPLSDLTPFPNNPRRGDVESIKRSLVKRGQYKPLVVSEDNVILVGNHTARALQEIGAETALILRASVHSSSAEAAEIVLVDNRLPDLGGYDNQDLIALLTSLPDLEVADVGYTADDLLDLLNGIDDDLPDGSGSYDGHGTSGALAAEFLVPPFSILDSTQGWWRARKTEWRARGIAGGVNGHATRAANLLNMQSLATRAGSANLDGTSVFDPVLAELAVRWWSAPGDVVLDPFAGGPCRGVVAAHLGREYHGVDLRFEQIADDTDVAIEQQSAIRESGGVLPSYYVGDATTLDQVEDLPAEVDMILTCPPYADLEVYSDDPADLSNMSYEAFVAAHATSIRQAADRLRQDRFLVWVIGEVRDPKTRGQRGLVAATVDAIRDAGLTYHCDAILVTAIASLALGAARKMHGTRMISRRHQHVIVAVKGSAKNAALRLGDIASLDAAIDAATESEGADADE